MTARYDALDRPSLDLMEWGQRGGQLRVAAALALGAIVGALTHERFADSGVPPGRDALVPGGAGVGFATMATLPGTPGLVGLAAATGLAVVPINPVLAVLL